MAELLQDILSIFNVSIELNILIFILSAAAIAFFGRKLAAFADLLADRTGLGEAFTGMILLGMVTSLPGIAASVSAALSGYAALAVSNAVGGIAVQTTFLAISDLVYPKANLEHASASATNMTQAAVLIFLLSFVLLIMTGPEITVGTIHPGTPVILLIAAFGYWIVYKTSEHPMWQPRHTAETVRDVPDPKAYKIKLSKLIGGFSISAVIVLISGAIVAYTAGNISSQAGISQTIMGGLFTAAATSLPELITTIAAVRRGALTLAVSDIIGGNIFDIIFFCVADIAFIGGSLYHAAGVGLKEIFFTGLTIFMSAILLIGLLYRQRHGIANIGFESVAILIIYILGLATISLFM